jgi:hypothetical protein
MFLHVMAGGPACVRLVRCNSGRVLDPAAPIIRRAARRLPMSESADIWSTRAAIVLSVGADRRRATWRNSSCRR